MQALFPLKETSMGDFHQPLSPADAAALEVFLTDPARPENTLTFHELQGFLFAIASSPETIAPSEWLPVISDDEDMGFRDNDEAQRVLNQFMTLYNDVNTAVLERSDALPPGCTFDSETLSSFGGQSSISRWSTGFAAGHDWLSEVWEEYLPDFMDEELGATLMALTFFSSRQLAEAYHVEINPGESRTGNKSFEEFAETIRELFPAALASYAHMGRTIFEVLSERTETD